jgi:hypothetical protein
MAGKRLLMLMLTLGVIACAAYHDLKVRYRLPKASLALEGIQVGLTLEDARISKAIIGPGAEPEFKSFTGNITFSMDDAGGAEIFRGQYDVMEMVKTAFVRRIEAEGISIVAPGGEGMMRLSVAVGELLLDLVEERWIARMDIRVCLEKDERLLATQAVTGEAERRHIIGRREAHRTVSEIFTDVVNRLDLQDLFKQAETANPGMLGR